MKRKIVLTTLILSLVIVFCLTGFSKTTTEESDTTSTPSTPPVVLYDPLNKSEDAAKMIDTPLENFAVPEKVLCFHNGKSAFFTPEDEEFWQILALNAARDTGVKTEIYPDFLKDYSVEGTMLQYSYVQSTEDGKHHCTAIIFYLEEDLAEGGWFNQGGQAVSYAGLASPDDLLAYLEEITK